MSNRADIILRRVVTRDIDLLVSWENNKEFWSISDRTEPVTHGEMESFVKEQEAAMFDLDQIRWMIVSHVHGTIGSIDLYEIDWTKDRACIGILIADKKYRNNNYASTALEMLKEISKDQLELELLVSRIQPHNEASIALFSKGGFSKNLNVSDGQNKKGDYIKYLTFELWLKK